VKAWFESRKRGPVEIQLGKTGQFDVLVDGRLVWSRHAAGGGFPSDADLSKIP
jgi:predicted Rdx family selenoprotein